MRSALLQLWSDRRGAAAAEMAMVVPFLVALMFGSLELGKFFLDEHIVVKSVRDGARFASRQNFATMPCGGTATNETQIKNVVRYGKTVVTSADKPRLVYWTNPATVTVAIACYDNSGAGGARAYRGIYADRTTVPHVTVSASVPYQPLAGAFGFNGIGLTLNASNQASVSGI